MHNGYARPLLPQGKAAGETSPSYDRIQQEALRANDCFRSSRYMRNLAPATECEKDLVGGMWGYGETLVEQLFERVLNTRCSPPIRAGSLAAALPKDLLLSEGTSARARGTSDYVVGSSTTATQGQRTSL